ncbi:hypothetical protein [Umezawaea sp.]|uniref:hypothetical protein n=1 Tax=Umezawaea sp. TaxID=1955258 RepID=UPI002ED6567B
MQRFWKLVSVVLVGLVATMITALAASPAQAEARRDVAAAHVQQVDAHVEPLTASQCVGYLTSTGYSVGGARLTACVLGSVQSPTAIVACTGALVATGVWFRIAAAACALAAIP